MRKKVLLIICGVILVALSIVAIKNIFFKSYNTSYTITEKQIEKRTLSNKITNLINEDLFNRTCSKDYAEKYISEQHRVTEYNDVLKELTQEELMKSILKSHNITLDCNSIKKSTDLEFLRMKTEESSKENYQSVKNVLSNQRMSEQTYIDLLYDYGNSIGCKSSFDSWFIKSKYYKDNRDPELTYDDPYFDKDEQIAAFIKKAMKNVKVTVK